MNNNDIWSEKRNGRDQCEALPDRTIIWRFIVYEQNEWMKRQRQRANLEYLVESRDATPRVWDYAFAAADACLFSGARPLHWVSPSQDLTLPPGEVTWDFAAGNSKNHDSNTIKRHRERASEWRVSGFLGWALQWSMRKEDPNLNI